MSTLMFKYSLLHWSATKTSLSGLGSLILKPQILYCFVIFFVFNKSVVMTGEDLTDQSQGRSALKHTTNFTLNWDHKVIKKKCLLRSQIKSAIFHI